MMQFQPKQSSYQKGSVEIKELKSFVTRLLPLDSALRELILRQPDHIDASEFIARTADWLNLLDIETSKRGT